MGCVRRCVIGASNNRIFRKSQTSRKGSFAGQEKSRRSEAFVQMCHAASHATTCRNGEATTNLAYRNLPAGAVASRATT